MGMYVSGGGLYKPARLDAWRNKLKADRRRRINQFAELLSQGYTITAAALEIGVSQQAGRLSNDEANPGRVRFSS